MLETVTFNTPLRDSVHFSQFPGHEHRDILVWDLLWLSGNLIMLMGLLKSRSTK